jgi:hypothetical protein
MKKNIVVDTKKLFRWTPKNYSGIKCNFSGNYHGMRRSRILDIFSSQHILHHKYPPEGKTWSQPNKNIY